MQKQLTLLSLAILLLLSACTSKKNPESTANATIIDVPFKKAKNYFVKNTYKDSDVHGVKITTQSEFDAIFGMGATMGEEGQPTSIDFSKQYVIACIPPTTDFAGAFDIENLKKSGNDITLTYNLTQGEKQSYSVRRVIIIIVDNQHQGTLKIQKK